MGKLLHLLWTSLNIQTFSCSDYTGICTLMTFADTLNLDLKCYFPSASMQTVLQLWSLTPSGSDISDISFLKRSLVLTWSPLSCSGQHGLAWKSDIMKLKWAQREKSYPFRHTEGISSACCGVFRDITSPGLMEDRWSSGRRAHSFSERTLAGFDVGDWSSRLEMDHRLYVTLTHLI